MNAVAVASSFVWPQMQGRLAQRAAALLLLVASGVAWPAPACAGPAGGTADARDWLARIHAAARSGSYEGTMVFTSGGTASSARVTHYCVGDQTYERIESLDGRPQRVFRHNELVHTFWSASRTAVIESRGALPGASPLAAPDPRASEHYEVQMEGEDRIAGRTAQRLVLQPRDALRYAQRLWADTATGLMLRADVIDARRHVLESAAFSQIEIGVKPQPELLLAAMRRTEGFEVHRPRAQPTQLAAEGWVLAQPVPGFALVGCTRRPLAPAGTAGSPEALHAVFFDGLAHVSVFVEPFDAGRHGRPLHGQMGATSSAMRRVGDHWITAIGDVPPATARRFVEALERIR